MFQLIPQNDDPVQLPPDLAITIGRGDGCDAQFDDPSVSRVHCRVIAKGGRVTVTDLGSRWGTFVNGQTIEQCDLRPGDRLRVGETVLKLELEGEPGETTLAPPSELQRPQDAETIAPGVAAHLRQKNDPIEDDLQFELTESADPQPLDPAQFLGNTFQRYKVQQTLATTSSSIVFRAKESPHGRPVALRIFRPNFFSQDVEQRRFRRAAETMFGRRHPNIVELYNAGRTQNLSFTASQLIEGESAVDMIRRIGVAGMLDPSTVLQLAVDLCEALRFAETIGIVHRNIRPSNILIADSNGTGRSVAFLNDLILTKASTESGAEQLTQAGDIIGDVGYMSPEQLGSGHAIDCRSDIYQLGVTLYALLTGKEPFSNGTMAERIAHVLTHEPPRIQELHMSVPPQFDTVVLKMLAKNPNERFQSANELAEALRKVAAETGQRNIKPITRDSNDPGWGGALDGLL